MYTSIYIYIYGGAAEQDLLTQIITFSKESVPNCSWSRLDASGGRLIINPEPWPMYMPSRNLFATSRVDTPESH